MPLFYRALTRGSTVCPERRPARAPPLRPSRRPGSLTFGRARGRIPHDHRCQAARAVRHQFARSALDALHRQPRLQGGAAARHPVRGDVPLEPERRPADRRFLRALQRGGRPRTARDRRRGPRPDAAERLFGALPARPAHVLRAGGEAGAAASRRLQPRLLHQLGLGVRRHRAQDRHGLSSRARRRAAAALRVARAGLSRGQHRRHVAGRDGAEPRDLRGGDAERGDDPPHLGSGGDLHPRRAGEGGGARGRPAAALRDLRRRDDRGGLRRAGGGVDGHAGAAEGVSAAAARDLRSRTGSCSSSTR